MSPDELAAVDDAFYERSTDRRKSEDYRAGIVASILAQAHGSKATPETFFPSLRPSPEELTARVVAQWKAFVSDHNARTDGPTA